MFSSRTLTDRPLPDFDTREDFLEDHWGDEVAKCTAPQHDRFPCSGDAVAVQRGTCNGDSDLWCANRVIEHGIDIGDEWDCEDCDRPIEVCWVVTPA